MRSGIGHAQNAGTGVFQGEVFVFKLHAINWFATSAIVIGEVSSLAHKLRYDAVKTRSFVAEAFFSGTKGPKVFRRFRNNVRPELEHDSAEFLAAGWHVKVHLEGKKRA